MGKKLAILIGVSEYQNIPNLDACKRDVDIMHSIIEYCKYDDTLFIDTETDSYSVKKKLTDFFEKHQNEETDVDQIFFYFSGHGTVDKENFHYLLSNYNTHRLASSSLSNDEIDNWIRSLNPKLTVKFVDACKSGTVYIKNNDFSTINSKAIPSDNASLGNCYFMFSSLNDEPSKAQNLSYFTEAIASAIEEQEEDGRVRFMDIIDYVRDTFSEEGIYAGEQTPYFVTQAKATEIFCQATSELKKIIRSKTTTNMEVTSSKNSTFQTKSKDEIIALESQKYCSKIEEIISIFNEILKDSVLQHTYEEDINNFYTKEYEFIKKEDMFSNIINLETAASIMEKKEKDYFIKIKYEERKVEEEAPFDFLGQVKGSFRIGGTLAGSKKKTQVIKRLFPIDFDFTSNETPYNYINIDFKSNYAALSSFNCSMLIAFSRKSLYILSANGIYKETSWNNYEIDDSNYNWKGIEIPIKETQKIKDYISSYLKTVEKHINTEIQNIVKSQDNQIIVPIDSNKI